MPDKADVHPNLYDLLGIDRDASSAAVKAAYLWRRKGAEAEAQADAADPEKLKLAFEVLSDAETRRHYDQTGEIPSRPAGPAAATPLQALLAELMAKALAASDDPRFEDLIKRMRAIAVQNLQTGLAQAAKLEAAAAKLGVTAERIHTTDDTNLLRSFVQTWQADLPKMIAEIRRVCQLHEQALQFLATYSYRIDEISDDII